MGDKLDESDQCRDYPDKESVQPWLGLNFGTSMAKAMRDIPQGNLTVYDIFQPGKSASHFEEDILFEQRLAVVDSGLRTATLTFSQAAEMLEMSLREFLEIFVLEDEWLTPLALDRQQKEQILDELTDLCEREVWGRSFREFVEECVLDGDFYSTLNLVNEDIREKCAEKALALLSKEPLGQVLREQLSVGATPREFVEQFVLTETWFSALQIPVDAKQALIDKAEDALCECEEYVFNNLWFTALAQRDRTIPDSLIKNLGEAIASRDTEGASVLLAQWDHRTILMSPNAKNAALLLSYYAQWVDFDSGYLARVKDLVPKFRGQRRTNPLELAHINIAEGLVEFHNENYDNAITFFDQAMRTADELRDDDLIAISRYYLARCFWKKGRYNKASEYASEALRLSDSRNRPKRVAAIKMVQGWLSFLNGELPIARELLEQAANELKDTDYINHGNVLSFRGRLDIKEGRYDEAMTRFREAIKAYLMSDRKHPHPNVARTHTNMAIACYDQARQLSSASESQLKLLELRHSAIAHLDAAEHIYKRDPQTHHRGLGKVHYLRALLYASVDERDRAQAEVEKAYHLGEKKGDHVLMGRAKRIQYKVTPDRLDRLALSEQTLVHAKQTDNRTLLARAYLNLGTVLKTDDKADEGDRYIAEAEKCLMPDERNNPYWREAIRKAREGNKQYFSI